MGDNPKLSELEYLHTEPVFKVRNNGQMGEMSASGIFRDKNEKAIGSFLVQISGDRTTGIEAKYYVEVLQRVLESLKESLE
jgi:hypothetical protein